MTSHSWDPGVPFYLPIDLETTGLDPDADPIIEVAWGILDYRLDDVAPIQSRVATLTAQAKDRLDSNDYVRKMHTENGLLTDQRAGVDMHLSNIEAAIIAQILALDGTPALALLGSSVHSDRRFIEAQMPTLYRLLHYRIFDVTTALNLFGAAELWEDQPRPIAHRAADDIAWSISEARRMRDTLSGAASRDAAVQALIEREAYIDHDAFVGAVLYDVYEFTEQSQEGDRA
jgi:oligoribonuclease